MAWAERVAIHPSHPGRRADSAIKSHTPAKVLSLPSTNFTLSARRAGQEETYPLDETAGQLLFPDYIEALPVRTHVRLGR